jgi:acyl carrier protein
MTTIEKLREMLARDFDFPADSLTPEATLESLGIDSLRMIEIVFAIEDAFAITVKAEPAELRTRLKSFGDLASYVDELAATKVT